MAGTFWKLQAPPPRGTGCARHYGPSGGHGGQGGGSSTGGFGLPVRSQSTAPASRPGACGLRTKGTGGNSGVSSAATARHARPAGSARRPARMSGPDCLYLALRSRRGPFSTHHLQRCKPDRRSEAGQGQPPEALAEEPVSTILTSPPPPWGPRRLCSGLGPACGVI